jgi:hypothetical protein
MRQVNVSSIRTRKSAMFRNKRQPAPPVKTGLMSKVKTLFGTKRQPASSVKTGPMSKGEDVVQQPERDDEDHAEGEEARQEKMT